MCMFSECFRKFKERRTSTENDVHEGCPSTNCNNEMMENICTANQDNHRLMIRELSNKFIISFESIQTIFIADLGMRRVAVKFVLNLLIDNKENH